MISKTEASLLTSEKDIADSLTLEKRIDTSLAGYQGSGHITLPYRINGLRPSFKVLNVLTSLYKAGGWKLEFTNDEWMQLS